MYIQLQNIHTGSFILNTFEFWKKDNVLKIKFVLLLCCTPSSPLNIVMCIYVEIDTIGCLQHKVCNLNLSWLTSQCTCFGALISHYWNYTPTELPLINAIHKNGALHLMDCIHLQLFCMNLNRGKDILLCCLRLIFFIYRFVTFWMPFEA